MEIRVRRKPEVADKLPLRRGLGLVGPAEPTRHRRGVDGELGRCDLLAAVAKGVEEEFKGSRSGRCSRPA